MRTLYVAAGGGGDAVGALLARRALGDTDERPPLVTTCAWERLRIDPVPGPRARTDFTGLGLVDGEPCEVLPDSDTVPSGRSVLPRLAETSGARIFLHDFEGGAIGLSDQLQQLAASLDVDHLVVVDVGGDIVARGRELDLRSPLADSLSLAAAVGTGIRTSVVVLGPGADAELPESHVLTLLQGTGAKVVGRITSIDVGRLGRVLCWHPTEASALVAAGAGGIRGSVAMRRGQDPTPITDKTSQVWAVSNRPLAAFPLADLLQATSTLAAAEDVMRTAAVNEIDYERKVAVESVSLRPRLTLQDVVSGMAAAGATHITGRRLSETLWLRGHEELTERGCRPRHGLWSRVDLLRMLESDAG